MIHLEDIDAGVEYVDERVRGIWLASVLFFGVGDTITTVLGLTVDVIDVVEAAPLVGLLVGQYGLIAFLPMKLALFAVSALIWTVVPRPQAVGVPLALAVTGVLVTAWNVVVIYVAYSVV